VKKERKLIMKSERTNDQPETEILKGVVELVATEKAIQEELGEITGEPDRRQKKLWAGLDRIYHSLRGPDELLERGTDERGADPNSYSRPFPPQGRIKRPQE